jgi:signal transduction histidine kinase
VRRRLAVVSAAVTAMVVLAFLIPLAGMVKTLARDRVLVSAERDAQVFAQTLSPYIVDGDADDVASVVGSGELLGGGLLSVVLPDGTVVGAPAQLGEGYRRAAAGEAFREPTDQGEVIWVPVFLDGAVGTAVVRVFVAKNLLAKNVTFSWLILGSLGIALVGLSALVADRLARSVVDPVQELSDAAHRLGEGDLTVRVDPDGPPEVVEVGEAFNRLARRVGDLLEEERRSAADLSHRLRTPLTALRLEIESTPDPTGRLMEDLDELERTVDYVIRQARRPVREGIGVSTDLDRVVAERVAFWGALADDQGRHWTFDGQEGPHMVDVTEEDAAAMVDALLGNVLSHTPEGTGFRVAVGYDGAGRVTLVVEDSGPGFPDVDPVRRGTSGTGSTGLGLDIVRRTVEATGGILTVGNGPDRGGRVEVTFGREAV